MKYYMITFLLIGYIQAFAQQPRLKQVDKYLASTGKVIQKKSIPAKKYCLLQTLYKEKKLLLLNLPELNDRGTQEVIPFGYKLNNLSEITLDTISGSLSQSTIRPLYNKSLFSGVSYQFCDSVVYGITLYYNGQNSATYSSLKERMDKFFKHADYSLAGSYFYSDPDYAVKLTSGKVEVYSLFHYPIVETFFPGVSHKVWYGPYTYETDDSSVMLAFYNQESKENNIQSAFKVYYKYRYAQPFKMNKLQFVLDDVTYEFPLTVENKTIIKETSQVEERNTRTFINPEIMKAMLRSNKLEVVLEGEGGRFSYKMPAFQRASLYTAYEYFRWTVTNPLAKYETW